MTKDWVRWHQDYDSPSSSLARRLQVVRRYLRRALVEAPCGTDGILSLVSMCAGDGRDVLPVLAEHDRSCSTRALLIELDPILSQRALTTAASLGLSGVEVRTADAGATDTYIDVQAAHVVMACGVFGNITLDDVRRTIATLPSLLVAGGIVIWTRGGPDSGHDPSLDVRTCLAEQGFTELSFTRPTDARFRVGIHQLTTQNVDVPQLKQGTRIFTFI